MLVLCDCTGCLCQNLVYHHSLQRSPFEATLNRKPDLTTLKRFGCLCFVNFHSKQDKFGPTALASLFLGYVHSGASAWSVMTNRPSTRSISVPHLSDFTFDETANFCSYSLSVHSIWQSGSINVTSLPKLQVAPSFSPPTPTSIPSALRLLWDAGRSRFDSAVGSRCGRLISSSSTDTDSDASSKTSDAPSNGSLIPSLPSSSSSSASPSPTSTPTTPIDTFLLPSIPSSPLPVVLSPPFAVPASSSSSSTSDLPREQ